MKIQMIYIVLREIESVIMKITRTVVLGSLRSMFSQFLGYGWDLIELFRAGGLEIEPGIEIWK